MHQKVYDQVRTAEAAAAATLLLILVPNTNLSLKDAASVKLSLARSRPSVIYLLTYKGKKKNIMNFI